MACTQCYKLFWIPTAWDLTNLERYYFEGTTLAAVPWMSRGTAFIHSQAGAWVAVD